MKTGRANRDTGKGRRGSARTGSGTVHVFARAAFAAVAILAFSGGSAVAATGSVVFSGSVTTANQCTIIVANDGTFGVSSDKRVLSSKLAGGSAAVAEVRSNHAYRITAIAVPVLTSYPVGGNLNVALQSLFSGQSILNGRTFAERSGTIAETLRNGLSRTRVTINLIATRTGSEFPVGYYQGTVTLRCE